jgi:hypothetical protein
MTDSIDWTDETFRSLDEIARIAFPPGSGVTAKTLKLPARQGQLAVYRPGKAYLCRLVDVRAMLEATRTCGQSAETIAGPALTVIKVQEEAIGVLEAAVRGSRETVRAAANVHAGAFDKWLDEIAPITDEAKNAERLAFVRNAVSRDAAMLPDSERARLVDELLKRRVDEFKAAQALLAVVIPRRPEWNGRPRFAGAPPVPLLDRRAALIDATTRAASEPAAYSYQAVNSLRIYATSLSGPIAKSGPPVHAGADSMDRPTVP